MRRNEETKELSLVERGLTRLAELAQLYRLPFLAAVFAGMLAHGFAFTNKLINADEVQSLFGKGATVTSGRWGLELSKILFPDVSMPWIYGIISILLLAATVCVVIRIFRIENRFLQLSLAAMFTAFPSETGVFCFMFTSAPYALAFLLAVWAVKLAADGGKRRWIFSALLLILSIGTYQAYTAIAAGFFVLLMIQRLLRGEGTTWEILLFGVRCLALLLISLAVYYAISYTVATVTGLGFASYGVEQSSGLLYRVLIAYGAFVHTFTRGYFAFVNSSLSMLLHGFMILVTALLLLRWLLGPREMGAKLLMLLCLFLFPLSVYNIYLIAEVGIIHSLVLCGFLAFYVLVAVTLEAVPADWGKLSRDVVLVSMILVTAGNIYFANKTYLKQYLQYENAQSFYTGLITQVKQTEGFQPGTKLAIIGQAHHAVYFPTEELDTTGLMGPNEDLLNIYTRDRFLQLYLGLDLPFATEEEKWQIQKDERFQSMPEYPYYGSVQRIDDMIVVKLG